MTWSFRRPLPPPCNRRAMNQTSPNPRLRCASLFLGVLLAGASPAPAQTSSELRFSLDFHGPFMGVTTPAGTPITEADLLIRSGSPFAPMDPEIALPGMFLDQYSTCAGHAPGIACGLEINAFSFGKDARLLPSPTYEFAVYLSVDEFAVGRPIGPGTGIPTIFTEALSQEAASDVFLRSFVGPGPFVNIPAQSAAVVDGDGTPSSPNTNSLIGLGLVEPIPPTPGVPESGSNLDAMDLGEPFDPITDTLFFSLQGDFPFCNEPNAPTFSSASSQALPTGGTASAGDILTFQAGVGVDRFARAIDLGLDRVAGPDSDDVDALMVVENGVPGYQPPTAPYSWLGAGATDLVLFSLRCGSGTIGEPDSISQLPITGGDILIHFAGQTRPGIWIPAEALGLETIARGGMANDELDGLDIVDDTEDPFHDCNGNGVEDLVDILNGTSDDCDGNGIPDECELPGDSVCDCSVSSSSACGNTAGADEGCVNNVGVGGKLVGLGTSSIQTDVFQLSVTQVTPNTFGIIVVGEVNTSNTVGNGRLCLGAFGGVPSTPLRLAVRPTGVTGAFTFGPGILSDVGGSPAASIVSIGSSLGFQIWYRDNGGPCGAPFNFTNAVRLGLTP